MCCAEGAIVAHNLNLDFSSRYRIWKLTSFSWHHNSYEIIFADCLCLDWNINRMCPKQVRALIFSE